MEDIATLAFTIYHYWTILNAPLLITIIIED